MAGAGFVFAIFFTILFKVHAGMNTQAAASMTEARIDAILSGSSIPSGGNDDAPSQSPPGQPSQPQPSNQPPASSYGEQSGQESVPSQPRTRLGKCVVPRHKAYVRASIGNSKVRLIAEEGEKFTYSRTSRGWYYVSNSRGSGWTYGRSILLRVSALVVG